MKSAIALFLIGIFAVGSIFAQGPTVKSMPPVVIRTSPVAGEKNVEPALSEIKVTFSKKMNPNSYSWVKVSDDTFPEMSGDVHFKNHYSCVAPVRLEPGKTYVIWFNSKEHANFKDLDGNPAVPYLLVFQTRNK